MDNRVIQQAVAHLGELDEHGRVAARALARLIGPLEQAALFHDGTATWSSLPASHGRATASMAAIFAEATRSFLGGSWRAGSGAHTS